MSATSTEATSTEVEKFALVAVVRANGAAMIHAQDCAHAKRAKSPMYVLREDVAAWDTWCTACRPDLD